MWTYRNDLAVPVQYNGVYFTPSSIKKVPFEVPSSLGLTLLSSGKSEIRIAGGNVTLDLDSKHSLPIPECNSFLVSIACFSGSVALRYNNDPSMHPVNIRANSAFDGEYLRKDVFSIDLLGLEDDTDVELVVERVS